MEKKKIMRAKEEVKPKAAEKKDKAPFELNISDLITDRQRDACSGTHP